MRTLVLAALVLTPALGRGQTVTSYNGTVLVPGLQEDYTVWIQGHSTGNSALQAYNALVDLKGGYLPANIPTSASIQSQATVLRAFLDSVGPGKVLVAHSMGGVVSRSMYQSNPSGVAGLVTIASPHGGTFTANNSSYLVPYLQTTITRLNQAGIPLGIVVGTPVLGPVVGGIVGHQFAQYVLQFRDSINKYFALPQSAINDLKVGAPAVLSLQSYSGDGALPRASVHGSIPVRNFPIRLLASLTDGEPGALSFNAWVTRRNYLMSGLKTCRVAYYVTVVFSFAGRKCSLAKKMLARMDGKWFAWVTGQPFGASSPRLFDGIVEESRARYPHLSDPIRKRIAHGSDHHSILFDTQGIIQTAEAMRLIGMTSR